VRLGQERARRGNSEDLRSLGGWFHETLAQAAGSHALTSTLTQLRHKISWMYAVEAPASPVESWAEHGAIVDAVARGDAERARA
ncbi:FCD domain-containing protein, partial [Streptomyces caniscabiei]